MLKLSIIIPVYNVEEYVASTLKSLFDQHDSAVEYIFVDDCGSDRSWQILEDTLKQYPECAKASKLIRLPQNGGVENARMNGLEQAEGEYIWFVDSDDLIAAGAINAVLKTLAECPVDYLAITLKLLPVGVVISPVDDIVKYKPIAPEKLFSGIINYQGKHGAVCNIVKRSLILQHPMQKTSLKIAEDYVMHCCWSIFANSAAILKKPVYGYVFRSQSVMRQSRSLEIITSNKRALQLLEDFSDRLPCDKKQLFLRELKFARIKMRMLSFIGILNNHDKTDFKDLMQCQIAAEYSLLKDIWKLPSVLQPIMFCDHFKLYGLMRCYVKTGMTIKKLLQ